MTKDFLSQYKEQVEQLLNNTRQVTITSTGDMSIPMSGGNEVPQVEKDTLIGEPTDDRPLSWVENLTIRATNYITNSNVIRYLFSAFDSNAMNTMQSVYGVPPPISQQPKPKAESDENQ